MKSAERLVCRKCGRTWFYLDENANRDYCPSCMDQRREKEKRGELRRKYKARAVQMLGGKCIICGYDKYQGALSFHHVDPSTKSITISDERSLSWKDMEKEVKKCVLLCMNCHREVEEGITELPDIA